MSDHYSNIKKYFYSYDPSLLYDISNPYAVQQMAFHIASGINFEPCKTVLEIGCGDGSVTFEIAKQFPNCTFIGIDISREAIEYAKKNKILSNIRYYEMDAFDIYNSFSSITFDIIFSFSFAQYVFHNDFIRLNTTLANLVKDECCIVHFSIPDIRKKFATLIAQHSLKNNFTTSLLKSSFFMLNRSPYCEYEDDGQSLWHSPHKLCVDLRRKFIVSAVTPSNMWYRFNLFLRKRSQ